MRIAVTYEDGNIFQHFEQRETDMVHLPDSWLQIK